MLKDTTNFILCMYVKKEEICTSLLCFSLLCKLFYEMEVVERFGALSLDKSKYMKNNTLLFCMVFIAAVVFFI